MKLKLDLTPSDLMELNDPETAKTFIQEAHALLDRVFEEKDDLIKCSITVNSDK